MGEQNWSIAALRRGTEGTARLGRTEGGKQPLKLTSPGTGEIQV